MSELKKTAADLSAQLRAAGLTPVADDPTTNTLSAAKAATTAVEDEVPGGRLLESQ